MADAESPKITTKFGKGNPGKPKGAVNKLTADVKAMILEALEHAGGAEYLCMQAYDHPKAFMALVGRVLPMQVTGEDGGPVRVIHAADMTDDDLAEIAAKTRANQS